MSGRDEAAGPRDGHDDARSNLRLRREILTGYAIALSDARRLFDVVSTTDGDRAQVLRAVCSAFGLTEIQAEAVLHLQVQRCAPDERRRISLELAELERHIESAHPAGDGEGHDVPGMADPPR